MSGKRNPAKLAQRKKKIDKKRQRQWKNNDKLRISFTKKMRKMLAEEGLAASLKSDGGEVLPSMSYHPSHVTRFSFDASTFDYICVNCGATDMVPGGPGELANPCPKPIGQGGMTLDEYYAACENDRT